MGYTLAGETALAAAAPLLASGCLLFPRLFLLAMKRSCNKNCLAVHVVVVLLLDLCFCHAQMTRPPADRSLLLLVLLACCCFCCCRHFPPSEPDRPLLVAACQSDM